VVIRGMARIGSTDGGWLCIASNGPCSYRCRLLWEYINRRNLYRAIMMLMTLLGFLWAVLILTGMVIWLDPSCCEKLYRFVRRPIPVPVGKPARRRLLEMPWWYIPIMAPPGQVEPTQCRRSYPFRRF